MQNETSIQTRRETPGRPQILNRLDPGMIRTMWCKTADANPGQPLFEIAEAIGVSEAELMAARIGSGVTRLRGDWKGLLARLAGLGMVRMVTRNRHAVLETVGRFGQFQYSGSAAQSTGRQMRLRFDVERMGSVFAAVVATTGKSNSEGPRRSLHFYGRDGSASHKVFLTRQSAVEEFEDILQDFVSPDQCDWQLVEPAGPIRGIRAITNSEVYAAIEGKFAYRVPLVSARELISVAETTQLPLTFAIASTSCWHAQTTPPRNHLEWNGLFSLTGRGGELHFRQKSVASAWVVQGPKETGWVLNLDLLDEAGNVVISVGPGNPEKSPELERWDRLVRMLPVRT